MKKIIKHLKKQKNLLSIDEYYNLGVAFFNNQQYDEAIVNFQKALNLNPNLLHAYNYLGNALQEKKQFDEAITYYQKAVQINHDDPTAYMNLGILYQNIKQHDESIKNFKKVIELHPNLSLAYDYMGLSLAFQGKLEQAYLSYQSSLRLNPNSMMSLVNLGNLITRQGHLEEAEGYYKRAIQVYPHRYEPCAALLMNMLYNPRYNVQTIYSENSRIMRKFAEPLSANIKKHLNECISNRKLRIGYVSPNFNRHPVAYFIEPIIALHNREKYEVFCYSDVQISDEITDRIISSTDQWRNIDRISDEKADFLIRKDKIDILIDLAGHTANNRMLLFARKPAPVQVTYMGYPGTTGLSTIDYKIVDKYTDPPGTTEKYYSEKLIRLPESFVCYQPDKKSPTVDRLPALVNGHITFGSFNNLAKISIEVFGIWSRILETLPNACLILKDSSLTDKRTCQYIKNMFTERGINPQRIILESWEESPKHLEAYNRIDIGLDTFPFNGLTTSCEAMWMGVPVVTLSGIAYASRAGVSLLSNVGLKELIANTQAEYVDSAVKLANDIKRLQTLREKLRGMMEHSPLTDANRFTTNLEICYRQIWERWCTSI